MQGKPGISWPIGVEHKEPNNDVYYFGDDATGEGIVDWIRMQLNPPSPQAAIDCAKTELEEAITKHMLRKAGVKMADLNEQKSRGEVWGRRPHWETTADTTGWAPSTQLTVHLKGEARGPAADRLMTLCAIYTSEELMRILPTVAEARLKLTPAAVPDCMTPIEDLRAWCEDIEAKLDAAIKEGDEQIRALTQATERHLHDIEVKQIAMQREIEQLRPHHTPPTPRFG